MPTYWSCCSKHWRGSTVNEVGLASVRVYNQLSIQEHDNPQHSCHTCMQLYRCLAVCVCTKWGLKWRYFIAGGCTFKKYTLDSLLPTLSHPQLSSACKLGVQEAGSEAMWFNDCSTWQLFQHLQWAYVSIAHSKLTMKDRVHVCII